MANKIKGYAYLDDKDVDVTSVLQNVFDNMDFTFGNPDKNAVGFIKGYPFYATYSPALNVLTLWSFKGLEDYQMRAIEEDLKGICDDEQDLYVEVEQAYMTFNLHFYFKDE